MYLRVSLRRAAPELQPHVQQIVLLVLNPRQPVPATITWRPPAAAALESILLLCYLFVIFSMILCVCVCEYSCLCVCAIACGRSVSLYIFNKLSVYFSVAVLNFLLHSSAHSRSLAISLCLCLCLCCCCLSAFVIKSKMLKTKSPCSTSVVLCQASEPCPWHRLLFIKCSSNMNLLCGSPQKCFS